MLDGVYNDFDRDRIWGSLHWDEDDNGFTLADVDAVAARGDYLAHYKAADLITINVGTNDVFSMSQELTIADAAELTGNEKIRNLEEQLKQGGDATAAFVKMLDSIQDAYQLIQIVQIFTGYLDRNFAQFEVNCSALLREIYALNPDVTIVAVGVYNPMANTGISEKYDNISLAPLFQNMTDKINDFLEGLCGIYRDFFYADVADISMPHKLLASMGDDSFGILMHPDKAGHRFMADQILAALPDALAAPVVTASNVAKSGKVKLTWKAVPGAVKYEIYRSAKKNGSYKKLYAVTGTTYTNTSAKAGNSYYYKVKAISGTDGTPDSRFSAPVYRTCDLAKPTGLKITKKNGYPSLTWTAVEGADRYAVYRCTKKNGSYVKISTTSGTTFTNTSAIAGNTYYYKIKALKTGKSAATSAFSGYVSIKAK